MALVTWNRWLEPYVDSGRELGVPWRVAQGQRLYADVVFHHGPLAPWLGAVCDLAFGRSLAARTALAAALALLQLGALDALARRMLSPGRAGLSVALAVAAAMFLRPGGWLFPFSFDAAIAVAAVTGALSLAARATRRGDALAGACLAAAMLARLELGLAGAAVLVLAEDRHPRRWRPVLLLPLAIAAAGYGVASAGIARATLTADGWLRLLDPPEAFANVYRAYAGFDRPGFRLLELLLAACLLAVVAVFLVAASLAARSAGGAAGRVVVPFALAALAAAAAVSVRPPAGLADTASLLPPLVRIVPPVVVLAAFVRVVERLRRREPRGAFAAVSDGALGVAAIFAVRLLLAAGYAGPYNAFFLPLPLVVAAAGLFGLADRVAPRLGPALPQLAAGALAVFLAVRLAAAVRAFRGPGWTRVDTPAGAVVLPEPVAETTRRALADLAGRLPADATLAGFPETGFFNYVLGRSNPYRREQYFPGHCDAAEEAAIAARIREQPPGALLYANVLAVGEGQRAFGRDYLAALDAAARERTRTAAIYGPDARAGARIGDPGFFVEIRVPAGSP